MSAKIYKVDESDSDCKIEKLGVLFEKMIHFLEFCVTSVMESLNRMFFWMT